jgi:membrane protease YdiL (CAAX protease family)
MIASSRAYGLLSRLINKGLTFIAVQQVEQDEQPDRFVEKVVMMENVSLTKNRKLALHPAVPGVLAGLLALAFAALVVMGDQLWLPWMERVFPNAAPNLWGLVSRGHMLLLSILVIAAWRSPRQFGFQPGKTRQSWKLILVLLALNCGIVGAYLALTGGTPYSGNEWLLTETVWVPLVEELVWRGVVFTLLLSGLRKFYSGPTSTTLAIWIGGVVFGLLHANNLLYGVPLAFVAVQVVNAVVWGVVYSFARARTESIYPPMLLHAAMNLMVIFF